MREKKADQPGYESVRGKHQEDITRQGKDQARYDRVFVGRI